MEENRYFVPIAEDFYYGYEFQMKIYESDDWINLIYDNSQNGFNIENNKLIIDPEITRVKYLDKEDIENEGWENVHDTKWWENVEPMYYWGADYKNAMMGYNPNDHTLVITFRDPCKSIDGTKDEYNNYPETKYGQFRGICKSKNEFRKIIKYLNIK